MKKLIIILFLTALPLFYGCEKDAVDYMADYYSESLGLKNVSIDSVQTFSNKVDNYVTINPEEKANPLYPKIVSNIKSAMVSFNITVDDNWEDSIKIEY